MLDRERADFFAPLDSLKSAFGPHVVATEIPIGSEHEVRGVVDLIDMEAFVYDSTGAAASTSRHPRRARRAQAEEYREKLMDEVAENSDELMERYLEGGRSATTEIVTALKRGVTEGHLFPVTCGVATSNLGTNRLLEALVEDLPSPAMRGAVAALGAEGEPIEIEPDEDGAAGRLRVQDDRRPLHRPHQHVPRLLAARCAPTPRSVNVTSGARRSGSASSGQPRGKELTPVDELGPGRHRRGRRS